MNLIITYSVNYKDGRSKNCVKKHIVGGALSNVTIDEAARHDIELLQKEDPNIVSVLYDGIFTVNNDETNTVASEYK